VTIGASYGDALLAATAAGLAGTDTRWNETVATVEPDARGAKSYDALYAVYRGLYPAMREQMHALAALQERTCPASH
jgi:xylulokinase